MKFIVLKQAKFNMEVAIEVSKVTAIELVGIQNPQYCKIHLEGGGFVEVEGTVRALADRFLHYADRE